LDGPLTPSIVSDVAERRLEGAGETLDRYLAGALDALVFADASGAIVEFNPAAEEVFGCRRSDVLGRQLVDVIVPPTLRVAHRTAFDRYVATGDARIVGRRVELTAQRADGTEFPVELALSVVGDNPLRICGAIRDLSQVRQAEARIGGLLRTQAALRRVATLVAGEAESDELFLAVAEEAAAVLGVAICSVHRFEPDGSTVLVGTTNRDNLFHVGERLPAHAGAIAEVWRSGRPARVAYGSLAGGVASTLAQAGFATGCAVPILVGGRTWGAVTALGTDVEPLPAETADSLAEFTKLITTAVANAQARSDLRTLVRQQAALRHVATAIARETPAADVFNLIAEEVARVLDVQLVSVIRYRPDATAEQVGAWGARNPFPTGTCWALDELSVSARVARTRASARVDDYGTVGGDIATRLHEIGINSAVGVPIVVDGELWGVMMALAADAVLSAGVEVRLADFTDLAATAIAKMQARSDLQRFVDEQEALRRVAVLVAEGADPSQVFRAVADEVRDLLDLPLTEMSRYDPDGAITVIGSSGGEHPFQAGTRWQLDGATISKLVLESAAPARVDDYGTLSGSIAAAARQAEIRAAVGVPILVDGSVWGSIAAASKDGPLPADTEERLTGFTELVAAAVFNTQARASLRTLVEEQTALRHVATLVAQGADSPEVFDAICKETAAVITASSVNLAHFTPDGFNLTMAGWSLRDTHVPTGTRLPLDGDTINALVQRTGEPRRVESYAEVDGALAALLRARGVKSEVGAPVIVDGHVWGALIAGWDGDVPPAEGVELRLAGFAELIATAVSNSTTKAELIASRARIVTSADDARQRIERNLHDGTQQRLVSLSLQLRNACQRIPAELIDARDDIERVLGGLEEVLDEVQEISRGLHPAILSQAGLGAALETLARRAGVPVELDVSTSVRPAGAIETAAYYLVSEAITNAVKYARASVIEVTLHNDDEFLYCAVRDDGIGGADPDRGTGLTGLVDRVAALGGTLVLSSPPGGGTAIDARLPLAVGAAP
jgi:PAS domain S-box-containing protein